MIRRHTQVIGRPVLPYRRPRVRDLLRRIARERRDALGLECRDIGPAAGLRADTLGFKETFLQLPEYALLVRRSVPDQLLIWQQAVLRLA